MEIKKAIESELSHSMVHYLLTIHKLKEGRGYARVTDIAKELELTKGSVSTAINNLKKKGLVEEAQEDSKFLNLTEEAHKEVHHILSARKMVYYFLKDFVGVNSEIASKDSCNIEYLLSEETREKLFNFMKELVCSCSGKNNFSVKTNLDLCKYETIEDFAGAQK